jgi:hypothetical protein
MSNRKLGPPIVIGATPSRAVAARKRSAPRVAAHRRRMRDGLGVFQVELSWQALRAALGAAWRLEGKRYNDNFVRDALQIFLEDWIAYGPRR